MATLLVDDLLTFQSSQASHPTNALNVMYATTNAGSSYPFLENGNVVIQARSSTGALRDIVFASGGVTPEVTMVVDRNRRVGIRNNAPRVLLDVGDSAAAFGATLSETVLYASRVGATNVVIRNNANNVEMVARVATNMGLFGVATNHALALYSNNTERLWITADGKVGIGGNTPRTLLDVGPSMAAPAAGTTETVLYVNRAGAANIAIRNTADNVELVARAGASVTALDSTAPLHLRLVGGTAAWLDLHNLSPSMFVRNKLFLTGASDSSSFDQYQTWNSVQAIRGEGNWVSWHDGQGGELRGYVTAGALVAGKQMQVVLGHADWGPQQHPTAAIHKHLTIQPNGRVAIGLGGSVPQARLQVGDATSSNWAFKEMTILGTDTTIFTGINYRFKGDAIVRKISIWENDRPHVGESLNLARGGAAQTCVLESGFEVEFWIGGDGVLYGKRTVGSGAATLTISGIWE